MRYPYGDNNVNFKSLAAIALATSAALSSATAADLIYGSWPPAPDYLNTDTLPKVFADIEKDTGGAVKWKLIAGGQLADGKGSFNAVKDGVMDAGLGIPIYVPNVVPMLATLYSSIVPGGDLVAVAGALSETVFLNCKDCLAESSKQNMIPLGLYASSSYQLMCRTPVATVADLKGKRVRATGGYGDLVTLGGGVPSSITLTDAVGLLQRGSLDCIVGAADWLKTYGYADLAKQVTETPLGMTGPAIGLMLSRSSWAKLTRDQKLVMLKRSTEISARHTINNFILRNAQSLDEMVKTKGVKIVKSDGSFTKLLAEYKVQEREKLLAMAKGFGVTNAAATLDAYDKALVKWSALSKGIGTDTDKFADALWREVLSKVDPDGL